jgi:hypothetical protein
MAVETNVVKPEMEFTEKDVQYLLMDKVVENILDSRISDIENYMSTNNGKGESEDVKNSLYLGGQQMWSLLSSALKDAKYNFYLNRPQYNFLTGLVLKKLEYDVNTVFFAIELTDMLGMMKNTDKYSNDDDLISFPVNTTEITYIYHLISKHTVVGLTRDAYIFAQILRKIGEISKIFNYYDATSKNLATDVQDWVSSFDEGVSIEEVKGEVVKPKKIKEKSEN